MIDLDPVRNRTCDVWHVWIEGIRPGRCMPVAKRHKICLPRARNRFGGSTNLQSQPPVQRHTSGSRNELPKVADGVDGGRMRTAIPIPRLFPDVGGVLSLSKEELCGKA
jgi:hypothetical protein